MIYKLISKVVFILLLCFSFSSNAQTPPFWDEIKAFKKQDSIAFPPKNAILFVGSSSFRYWADVQDYFPEYPIINRGFGGSKLTDVIRYADDIIFPYQPKQILIYCGENDFGDSDTAVSVSEVVSSFKTLYTMIRAKMPAVNIMYVSMKPSIARQKLMPKFEEANKQIKAFLVLDERSGYIDVYSKMIDKKGRPFVDLFKPDNLHMKPNGYAIWQKVIKPYLLK